MNLAKNITLDFYHDWDSFSLAPMRWRDFTFIQIAIETNGYSKYLEITIAILGLHFCLSIFRDLTAFNKELDELMDAIKHGGLDASDKS